VKHSRSFSIVTRYGGDEFAIILVNTAKGGGVTYADRIRGVIEQHHFAHTPVTVSLGVASIPEDATKTSTTSSWPPIKRSTTQSAPAGTASRCPEASAMVDREKLLAELIEIGIALTSERDLYALLDRILDQARRFTRAEAGTLFLRDGEHLRFAVVQNDLLERKLGKHETQRLLPGRAPPAERVEPGRPRRADRGARQRRRRLRACGRAGDARFNQRIDATSDYADPVGAGRAAPGPERQHRRRARAPERPRRVRRNRAVRSRVREAGPRARGPKAAVGDPQPRLEDLSFKDSLTELYNRRYFALRIEEEVKRHTRFGHPLSLVVLNVDHFKKLNEEHGRTAGDEVLREVARSS